MLAGARTLDAVTAALELLDPHQPDVRAAILERYEHFAEKPTLRDPSTTARAVLLRGLGEAVSAGDVPLLEAAAATYEYLPPGPKEVAGRLRGAALVALAAADERLAAFTAARLLGDPHTSEMSGEPAVTAVRVLASLGQTALLYGYLEAPGARVAEAAAEALRSLVDAPPSVVGGLAERYAQSPDEIVLVGLFDLLLARPDRQRFVELTARFLRETKLVDVFRYLVTAIVAGRDPVLIGALRELRSGLPPPKLAILEEALALT